MYALGISGYPVAPALQKSGVLAAVHDLLGVDPGGFLWELGCVRQVRGKTAASRGEQDGKIPGVSDFRGIRGFQNDIYQVVCPVTDTAVASQQTDKDHNRQQQGRRQGRQQHKSDL